MSGESRGLIVLPLLFGGMPLLLGGLAVAGVAYAAIGVARAINNRNQQAERNNYYQQQNQRIQNNIQAQQGYYQGYNEPARTIPPAQPIQRPQINTSVAESRIGSFRDEMYNSMNEQSRLNAQAFDSMMSELSVQREELQKIAEQNDVAAYQEYLKKLKESREHSMQNIYKAQNDFNNGYKKNIAETMANVTASINEKYAGYMSELEQLKADIQAKDEKAKEIAKAYIEEAQALLKSLRDDFEGEKYSSRQMVSLTNELNQAIDLYNKGRYESALASSKDVAVNTLDEIFEADARKQEWENYYGLALVLSEEVKCFIEAQGTVSREVKEYAEKAAGKPFSEDIAGIKISDYTDRNAKGQTRYDYILSKINEIHSALRAENADKLTLQQLKECIDFLNNDLYPQASQCINKGIINMNNAFSRQNMSEEIIDFFEEHNFTFNGYAYENDSHDKALHIGLSNESTGEELIVTLAPEVMQDGDIQTRVDLKQIKGDEANEERKAYYRECIESVVKGSNPYASVDIKCNAETRNKLSADTETKKKLKME